MWASARGHLDMVQLLIEAEASVYVANHEGWEKGVNLVMVKGAFGVLCFFLWVTVLPMFFLGGSGEKVGLDLVLR